MQFYEVVAPRTVRLDLDDLAFYSLVRLMLSAIPKKVPP